MRLLPIVIGATLALLVLKGVGLITAGGYVLTGPSAVQAAGAAPSSHGNEPAAGQPGETTMTDSSPTLQDGAPTLPLRAGGDAHGAAEEGEVAADDAHGTAAADDGHGATSESSEDCPPADDGHAPDPHGAAPAADCGPVAPVNAAGDALPMIKDGTGEFVPLRSDRAESADAVLERLGARRDALDAREEELDMRMALVEAAERRIDERAAALEELEGRIKAMVEEKKSLEEAQFVAIVAMYETMKPKDAAAIFDQLELPVMLRVARAMSPRKMAPIMAKMDPLKARDLTSNMAIDRVEPTIDLPEDAFAGLPQIVGQ